MGDLEAGDLPGWGTGGIGGRISADTSLVCAGLCNAKTNCLSFEWSPTQKKCNLNTEAHPTGRPYRDFDFCSRLPEVYIEGRLDNAEYTGSPTFSTEAEVTDACNALDRCRGMWQQRGSNVWQMLFDGSRSWAQGVPNGTVLSVKIRVSKVAPVVPETCAPGYDLEAGDLPGWGTGGIGGRISADTSLVCAGLCNA